MQRLGFTSVCRSTLSDANHRRPLGILEETYSQLLKRAQQKAPRDTGFRFKGPVQALDGTIIDLCLSLSPWANFRKGKAAVKLHTAIDIAGDLPEFVVITPGRRNEIPIAKQYYHPKPGTTVLIDRGYWDSQWLSDLNEQGVYFVTRQRKNNYFKVVESRPTDRTRGHICDQTVYQYPGKTGPRGRRYKLKYRGKLRRISYRDPDTKKRLVFLTNRFDLAVSTICELYKARWKVELFFKTLKQNLRVKKFLGNSAHAVKAQILVALIAYLLVQIIRFEEKSKISMPDAMAVIATLLLLREPVSRLFGELPRVTRHPPSSQLLLPF
jgi:putative transposase